MARSSRRRHTHLKTVGAFFRVIENSDQAAVVVPALYAAPRPASGLLRQPSRNETRTTGIRVKSRAPGTAGAVSAAWWNWG